MPQPQLGAAQRPLDPSTCALGLGVPAQPGAAPPPLFFCPPTPVPSCGGGNSASHIPGEGSAERGAGARAPRDAEEVNFSTFWALKLQRSKSLRIQRHAAIAQDPPTPATPLRAPCHSPGDLKSPPSPQPSTRMKRKTTFN